MTEELLSKAHRWALGNLAVALDMAGGDVDRAATMLPSNLLQALLARFDTPLGRERLDDPDRVIDALSREIARRGEQDNELSGPAPSEMGLDFLRAFAGGQPPAVAVKVMETPTLEKVAAFFRHEDVSRILASAADRPAYLPREMSEAVNDELRRRGSGVVA